MLQFSMGTGTINAKNQTTGIRKSKTGQREAARVDKEDYFFCAILRYSIGKIPVFFRNSSANRLEVE